MTVISIKSGTPAGSTHLCKQCTWGQYVTGYRESDLVVICMRPDPSFTVPFVVYERSEFSVKNKPSWEQMTKLAIEVAPPRVSSKMRGFQVQTVATPAVQADLEDEGEDDFA
ncbi:MAG: hypothetical protein KGN79_14815 [Acidobacteriota bacterium]|nr:hypothetical protein [Acidobacteriota bacterium]